MGLGRGELVRNECIDQFPDVYQLFPLTSLPPSLPPSPLSPPYSPSHPPPLPPPSPSSPLPLLPSLPPSLSSSPPQPTGLVALTLMTLIMFIAGAALGE